MMYPCRKGPLPSALAILYLLLSLLSASHAFSSEPVALCGRLRSSIAGRKSARSPSSNAAECLFSPRPRSSFRPNGSALSASATGTVVTKGFGVIFTAIKVCFCELKALSAIQSALFAAALLLGIKLGRTTPFWRRLTNVLDIPSSYFGPDAKTLRGCAVKVSDGDTIRFLHTPLPWSPTQLEKGQKLSENALPIRICTIDTPETAKFGKSGQPFGPEAKEKMKKLCENQIVRVRLLQKDQYGRGVASVLTGRWPFRKPVDEVMLLEGLAEVYQGSGAVYGSKGLDAYLEMEEEARKAKVGIWSDPDRESAAEYKRRTK